MSQKSPGSGTAAVWSAESGQLEYNATVTPVVNAATYAYETIEDLQAVYSGEVHGHTYGRSSNPTVAVFEEKMRILEGAEAATSFASGMAAISNSLLALLAPGDRIVSQTDCYGGTAKMFSHYLPRNKVEVTLCPGAEQDALIEHIRQGCKVVYLETPTNPVMKLLDIAAICREAHTVGAVVIVDNTVATPFNQSPLALGADMVVHSATKFIGGHSDVIGGIACGKESLIKAIFDYREITGACLDPNAAFLLIRGLKTLELRVNRHNENAMQMANWLQAHPKVAKVNYPGLESHPQHPLAKAQMQGFSGMLSFTLVDKPGCVSRFLNHLQYAHIGGSLGSVDTLIGPPSVTSHAEFSAEERAALGIEDTLIRVAIGIENFEDLRQDFAAALAQV